MLRTYRRAFFFTVACVVKCLSILQQCASITVSVSLRFCGRLLSLSIVGFVVGPLLIKLLLNFCEVFLRV